MSMSHADDYETPRVHRRTSSLQSVLDNDGLDGSC